MKKGLKGLVKLDLIRRINNVVDTLNQEIQMSESLKRLAQRKLKGDLREDAISLIKRFGKFETRELTNQFTKETRKDLINEINLNEDKIIEEMEIVRSFNVIMSDILRTHEIITSK